MLASPNAWRLPDEDVPVPEPPQAPAYSRDIAAYGILDMPANAVPMCQSDNVRESDGSTHPEIFGSDEGQAIDHELLDSICRKLSPPLAVPPRDHWFVPLVDSCDHEIAIVRYVGTHRARKTRWKQAPRPSVFVEDPATGVDGEDVVR
jgi:hypothetical protein